MYRIIKRDGTELGITDAPFYIKYGASGCFTPAAAGEAIGVAYNSVPYNLLGHEDIPDAETVVVKEIDGGGMVGGVSGAMDVLLGVAE